MLLYNIDILTQVLYMDFGLFIMTHNMHALVKFVFMNKFAY